MARRLQIIQRIFAVIGVVGVIISIVNQDLTGMIESFVIIFIAIIGGFLDSYVRKKQGLKNNS